MYDLMIKRRDADMIGMVLRDHPPEMLVVVARYFRDLLAETEGEPQPAIAA
jgi:hypothetical protein